LKILLLDVNYGSTSTGQIVFNLKKHFERKGHEVQVCYGRHSGEKLHGATKISYDFEVYAHAALSRLTGLNGVFSPIATAELIKKIVDFEPDVVHLHELHGYYLNASSVINYLKQNDIPTVWTFHCEIMYTGNCGYAYDCMKWKESCGGCPQLREYPKTLYFDFTAKMLSIKKSDFNGFSTLKIISVSEWLAARVEESFLGGRGSGVVHNGIDTENIFKPKDTDQLRKDLGITTDHIIVSIAPDIMSERKGGAWIFQVAKRLETQSVTFVLVGVKGNIENDSSNVICLPATNDLDLLATYYSLGDYFLLTSKKETFSLTCVESLACGTPILGFDCGAPTQIAPIGYGKFVTYGDLEALVNLVVTSLNDRSQFFAQRDCLKYANEAYSLDAMGESYLEVFQALLKRGDEQRLECLE
jgi:putative colanic acid biosynthesis glycosyltransferase